MTILTEPFYGYEANIFITLIFFILTIPSIITCIICLIDAKYLKATIMTAIFVFSILGLAISLDPETNFIGKTPYTEYKVTLSDDVSYNEFLEKYEVIEEDGKILTVREK